MCVNTGYINSTKWSLQGTDPDPDVCWSLQIQGSQGPYTFTSTYKLNLPSKALQVLIFASRSLQV